MEKIKRHMILVQILLIFCWLSFLADSDSYYMPYLIVGLLGTLCLFGNLRVNIKFKKNIECFAAVVMASCYSFIVLMANYYLLADSKFTGHQGKLIRVIYIIVLFLGGVSGSETHPVLSGRKNTGFCLESAVICTKSCIAFFLLNGGDIRNKPCIPVHGKVSW